MFLLFAVPGPPLGIRAVQTLLDAALLSWLPPKPEKGIIQHYTLHHRPPHHTHSATRLTLSAPHLPLAHTPTHLLTQLKPGTHELWLTAHTSTGEGSPSTTLRLNIDPAKGKL